MFGEPQPLPEGANLLPLIGTYILKSDGTKKARCICYGSPHRQGIITLAHTDANALKQPGVQYSGKLLQMKA